MSGSPCYFRLFLERRTSVEYGRRGLSIKVVGASRACRAVVTPPTDPLVACDISHRPFAVRAIGERHEIRHRPSPR